ncbi:hypothetical protein PYCCODRAFT_635231 [Trametes coccinea BRFM310]|uniref:Cell wall protein n=1 Tax=Trametes coccinea (strain BRFM310) TaxID=1353009 RepID=A0A1Y2ILI9_TRAC3|nr:hypothetical protein PYCCODRAFT_635231 [Trametes coccinea BRFM310]
MRITPSSSFFLATLAISSSSSALAAPTEQQAVERSGFPSSSSIRSAFMATRGDAFDMEVGGSNYGSSGPSLHMSTHQTRGVVQTLEGLLPAPVGDVVTGLLNTVCGMLGLQVVQAVGAESLPGPLSDTELQTLLQLVQQTAQKMTSAVSGTVGAVKSARRVVEMDSAGNASSMSSFPPASSGASFNASSTVASSSGTQPTGSLEAMAVPTPPVGLPNLPVSPPVSLPVGGKNNSSGPSTPPLPVNPPNTPVPVGAPKPPVPAGVAPPSLPLAKNAPPMFPGFKAADASMMSSSPASASSSSCASGSASMAAGSGSCTAAITATGSQAASATPSSS